MKRVLKRFSEMFFRCVSLSAVIMFFDEAGVLPRTQVSQIAILSIGAVLYIYYIVKRLRRYYRKASARSHYYIKSYAAYAIFAVITVAFYLIFGRYYYAWLFCVTMPFFYILDGIALLPAILIFHGVMLIVIALAPKRFKWRDLLYLLDNYDEDY